MEHAKRTPGLLAALLCLSSCAKSDYVRVEEVYISKQVPALERAAREMSTARKEGLSVEAAKGDLPELSVEVIAGSGLGREEFRIVVAEGEVRVEGGGTAGALYGGLEAAGRMRRGLSGPALAIARASPRFERRILRAGLALPGLSAAPDAIDEEALFDALSTGRFNTLAVACGDAFPRILRLPRFPKAFAGLPEAGAGSAGLKEVLALAESRSIRLLVTPVSLRIPQSFLSNYGARPDERSSASALGRSYLKECLAELLRTYPQIAGLGISRETLRSAPGSPPDEIARAVFLEGIRASGRKAYLFIHESAGESLKGLVAPHDIEILREVEAPAALITAHPATGSGVAKSACVRIPRRVLFPSLPTPARAEDLMRRAAATYPAGFLLDGFDPPAASGKSAYLFAREAFLTGTFGLCGFDPGIDESGWKELWEDVHDRAAGSPLGEALASLEGAWAELALFHRAGPGWSPLSPSEHGNRRSPGSIRDASPSLSLLELVFTRTLDPSRLSIPEGVALELRRKAPNQASVEPLEAAAAILEKSSASLASLEDSRDASPDAQATRILALEIEGLSRIAACHGRRIRAGVFLLRYAAGLGRGAREEAMREVLEASRECSLAETAFSRLRDEDQGGFLFPDMSAWRAVLEEDAGTIERVRTDTTGFRASPLLEAHIPLSSTFDLESVRGFIHIGCGILDNPPVALTEDAQIFEAEDMVGSWSRFRDIRGFSGTGYMSSGLSGALSEAGPVLRIRVERAGSFQVWVRAAEGGGESCGLRLRLQGVLLPATHASRDGSRRFEWEKAGQVTIAPGEAFLQAIDHGTGREGLDAVVLTRDARWVPPAS